MAKKIAILVRDRKSEALRMAVGATLADFDVKIFSNNPDNQFEQKSTEEIARALPEYDVIIPY